MCMKKKIKPTPIPIRDLLIGIKVNYDRGGIERVVGVLAEMLNHKDADHRVERFASFVIDVVAKMHICYSNCFEDLDTKDICSCLCYDAELILYLNEKYNKNLHYVGNA